MYVQLELWPEWATQFRRQIIEAYLYDPDLCEAIFLNEVARVHGKPSEDELVAARAVLPWRERHIPGEVFRHVMRAKYGVPDFEQLRTHRINLVAYLSNMDLTWKLLDPSLGCIHRGCTIIGQVCTMHECSVDADGCTYRLEYTSERGLGADNTIHHLMEVLRSLPEDTRKYC